MATPILTTKFNAATWAKNLEHRSTKGCLYGSPKPIVGRIPSNVPCFIIEMNNSSNRIEGVGMIRNNPAIERNVYDDGNHNNYVFEGVYRIDRSDLLEHCSDWIIELETRIFKGKANLKRGSGLNSLPEKLVEDPLWRGKNLRIEISRLFKTMFLPKLVAAVEVIEELEDDSSDESSSDDDIEASGDDEEEDQQKRKRKRQYSATELTLVKKSK